ncbi:MAG: DnaJ domain-containing protein [Myxococcota bacterium]
MYELSALLDDLDWTPRQCAVRLDISTDLVEQWLSGALPMPKHHLHALRQIAKIHNPQGAAPREDPSRTTHGEYAPTVDNIYDNYDSKEPEPEAPAAPTPSRETPDASAAPDGAPAPGAQASEGDRPHPFNQVDPASAARIRELEEELARLRQSYKEVSTKYAQLEQAFEAYRKRQESTSSKKRRKKKHKAPTGAYEALGLGPDAPWQVIKNTYRALCLIHHPDRGGDIEKMQKITQAYNELRAVFGH